MSWTIHMCFCLLSHSTSENDSKYFNQQKRDQRENTPNKQANKYHVQSLKNFMDMSLWFPRWLYIPNGILQWGGFSKYSKWANILLSKTFALRNLSVLLIKLPQLRNFWIMCYNCSEDYHDVGTNKFQKWMTFLTCALYIILKEKVRGLLLGLGGEQ